jgi:hypothetical protein
LPAELKDGPRRLAKLQAARAALKERAAAQGREPDDDDKGNPTDPDSRIQRKPQGFVQGYNAQLAVSAESGLIVAAHVTGETTDRQQLAPMVAAIAPPAGRPHTVVADRGYDNHAHIEAVAHSTGAKVCVPPQWPLSSGRSPRRVNAQERHKMAARLRRREETRSPWGQQLRRLRHCVIEPVFGALKHNWSFQHFRLRGLAGVNIEWLLLCTAYNLRKIQRLTAATPA